MSKYLNKTMDYSVWYGLFLLYWNPSRSKTMVKYATWREKSNNSTYFFFRHSFHDFNFYEFQVQGIYYVGGFGGINYIGWIPVDLYQKAGAATEKKLIHQNQVR
jgi:hypothetical protein